MYQGLRLQKYNGERVLLDGGIGDFLQCLPFMIANRKHAVRYIVTTHFRDVGKFFDAVRIKPEAIFEFSNLEEQSRVRERIRQFGALYGCPRFGFFERSPFAVPQDVFANGKPTVGIHIGGSTYSIGVQKQLGLVSKALPAGIIEALRSPARNILVFGSREETSALKIEQGDGLRFIDFPDIAKSLSFVATCAAVVASDSAIKTMSAMLKIPTMVWLGNYRDDTRDQTFIDPYVKAAVMTVFRYGNLDSKVELANALESTQRFLDRVLEQTRKAK